MIHQTINWPNQRLPVFLCDAQYKLPSSGKQIEVVFSPLFFPEICCFVMRTRRNEFESDRGQKLAVLVAYSTVIWTLGPFSSCPRAMVMLHPLSTVYESSLALS